MSEQEKRRISSDESLLPTIPNYYKTFKRRFIEIRFFDLNQSCKPGVPFHKNSVVDVYCIFITVLQLVDKVELFYTTFQNRGT